MNFNRIILRDTYQVRALSIIGILLALIPLNFLPTFAPTSVAWREIALFYTFVFVSLWALYSITISNKFLRGFFEPGLLLGLIYINQLTSGAAAGTSGYVRLTFIVILLLLGRVLIASMPLRKLILLTVCVVVLQAIWGIAQFSLQDDLGLQYLGEANLGDGIPGIATFSANDDGKLSRAYGGYLHANPFGGSIAIGLAILLFASSYFQYKQLEVGIFRSSYSPVIAILAFVLSLGVLVSFSRAAILSAMIAWLIYFIKRYRSKNKYKTLLDFILPILITLIVFMPLFSARLSDQNDVAISERINGLEIATKVIGQNSIWRGTGIDNYNRSLQVYLDGQGLNYEPWQIAPLHSVPVLVVAEFGILTGGLAILLLGIMVVRLRHFAIFLAPLLPLLIFDHYTYSQFAPAFLALLLFLIAERLKNQDDLGLLAIT